MTTSMLKPGLLVGLKTRNQGGVQYSRVDLRDNSDGKTAVAEWQTTRIIDDVDEHDRARTCVSSARSRIASQCIRTSFGLLCPHDREPELDAAIAESTKQVQEFNQSARRTRVSLWALKGRIAGTDEQAARAITAELREILDDMKEGVATLAEDWKGSVERIREAASRAKKLGGMLNPDQEAKVSRAVENARKVAREITKRVEKEGDAVELVKAEINTTGIDNARFAFLELDEQLNPPAEPMPATIGRDLDVQAGDVQADTIEPGLFADDAAEAPADSGQPQEVA